MVWNVIEYLALFGIVLTHEFGHALACRQVGGQANQIVLWPLGGVAYVAPPQRPKAMLWSIAAGPLVNVVLLPVFTVLLLVAQSANLPEAMPNAYVCLRTIWDINLILLIFNLLPIYPLDGGQILRSLLWFPFGRARSLMVATVVGFAGVACLVLLAILAGNIWIGVLAVFILLNCWGGLMQARALVRLAKAPRHEGFACPSCQSVPPLGAFWICGKCRTPFDMFASGGVCPKCGTQYEMTRCLECGGLSPMAHWNTHAGTVPPHL